MLMIAIFFTLPSCEQRPANCCLVSVSGIYNRSQLRLKGITVSNPSDTTNDTSYAIIKMRNQTNLTLFLPIQKKDSLPIYYPSYVKYDYGTSIIDYFDRRHFITFKPMDSLSLISEIPFMKDGKTMPGSHFVLRYPYVFDTANILVDFFDIKVSWDNRALSGSSILCNLEK